MQKIFNHFVMCLPAGSKTTWTFGCWEHRRSTGKSNDNCCLWSGPGQYIVLELGGIPGGHSKGNIQSSVSYKINVFKVLFWETDKWGKSGDCCEINLSSVTELCNHFFFWMLIPWIIPRLICVLIFRTLLVKPKWTLRK